VPDVPVCGVFGCEQFTTKHTTGRHTCLKMADEVDEGIENALNLVVLTTERSGNVKKDLKQTIFETVSTLRNLFVKMKNNCEVKSSKISELEAEVTKV
jgi:hypothetical protein